MTTAHRWSPTIAEAACMGIAVWNYLHIEDGKWKRVSVPWVDRFWDGDERLPGATEARFAEVVLMLKDRKPPMQAPQVNFPRYRLNAEGGVDEDIRNEAMAVAASLLGAAVFGKEREGPVVDASHRFAKRAQEHISKWHPSDADLAALRLELISRGLPRPATAYIVDTT